MPLILTGTSASTTLDSSAGLTFSDSSNQSAAASPFGLKNRIINGDMAINQRSFSGTAVDATYSLDRWLTFSTSASRFTISQSSIAPAGFINSLLITSSSAYTPSASDEFGVSQLIEGLNVSDLGWGTANAQTVTLSFWVRSSVTGTFGGSIGNSGYGRSYPFSYTINSANTWEKETITIPGDTSGTWLTTNGVGIRLRLTIGAGSTYQGPANAWSNTFYDTVTGATNLVSTNGATFYITGVQLERNTTATPFEWIPYGLELALCQRYYYKIQATAADSPFSMGSVTTTTIADIIVPFPVSMRTNPTALEQTGTAGDYRVRTGITDTVCSAVPTLINVATTTTSQVRFTVASGLTVGNAAIGRSVNSSAYLGWSAEL